MCSALTRTDPHHAPGTMFFITQLKEATGQGFLYMFTGSNPRMVVRAALPPMQLSYVAPHLHPVRVPVRLSHSSLPTVTYAIC